ncbi:hypothetical protein [Methylobacterium sp. E-046]|uniref:hypothetical protein n=1 Tax=Methylobacterium sp. E-046 TaxID=2836576 RepID=UPI001FB8FC13|nr:hypothetical protein [Methylobacterium sp. E-046]MCJ2099675.1 hypothetical protein [Methylobacterium sp. E-046]
MPTKPSTVADLRKAGTISSLEIVAAVDAYMRDANAGPYCFNSGHSIDLAAAVAASPVVSQLQGQSGPQDRAFRTAVTALAMLVCPTPL